MSSTPLPHHQYISGTSARDGAQAFAGIVHGNVYYGNTGSREPSTLQVLPKLLSTVPFRRDPDSVDRGDVLAQIHQRYSQPTGRAALVGPGDKSQLAVEYSYRVRERPLQTWVFWVHAINAARLEAAYKSIADRLQQPGRDDNTVNVLRLVCN